MNEITYLQAIAEAQREEMRRDERVFMMGEDVQTKVYGSTEGFLEEFGPERMRNTPISEATFVGAAAGAAMVGMRPIVDLSIASFIYLAADQLISIIAKSTYLYGGQTKLPLVVRTVMFYQVGSAAQHSDRPYPMFMAIPGLKIIAPSNPSDMKGLLKSAIRDDDPVLCFEDVTLWATKGEVPDEDHLVPLGVADVKRAGSDVTVVAIAGSVQHTLTAAAELAEEGISVEVVDPRSLAPLDMTTILKSVAKTGRLAIVEVATRTCGAASEIAATVAEEAFGDLKAPIVRVTTPRVLIPFGRNNEQHIYPNKEKIIAGVRQLLK